MIHGRFPVVNHLAHNKCIIPMPRIHSREKRQAYLAWYSPKKQQLCHWQPCLYDRQQLEHCLAVDDWCFMCLSHEQYLYLTIPLSHEAIRIIEVWQSGRGNIILCPSPQNAYFCLFYCNPSCHSLQWYSFTGFHRVAEVYTGQFFDPWQYVCLKRVCD